MDLYKLFIIHSEYYLLLRAGLGMLQATHLSGAGTYPPTLYVLWLGVGVAVKLQ